ncbi:hypothetical protein RIF29_20187 [Crotalaria pallida]|uniref:Uncharacterized protein n=1 Tax=Crotalaria pallida TaxID=3830 RepID=A0AAN9F0N9_CROPI
MATHSLKVVSEPLCVLNLKCRKCLYFFTLAFLPHSRSFIFSSGESLIPSIQVHSAFILIAVAHSFEGPIVQAFRPIHSFGRRANICTALLEVKLVGRHASNSLWTSSLIQDSVLMITSQLKFKFTSVIHIQD